MGRQCVMVIKSCKIGRDGNLEPFVLALHEACFLGKCQAPSFRCAILIQGPLRDVGCECGTAPGLL